MTRAPAPGAAPPAATADEVVRAARVVAAGIGSRWAGTPLALPDVVGTRAWLRDLPRLPAGTTYTAEGLATLVGTAMAVRALATSLGARPRACSAGALAVADALRFAPRHARASDSAASWRGYLRRGSRWVSLAVAGTEVGRLRAALDCQPAGLDASAAATELQRWGLAALPARSSTTAIPGTGDASCCRLDAGWLASLGSPLAGVHVLDLGQLIAGTWACELLAAAGAHVVSVAHPVRAGSRWYGRSPRPLDVAGPSGRGDLAALCATADVVVDNFRPRVWENWDLDPVTLGARVHVTLPAFPGSSARRNDRAYGFQTEAYFGAGALPVDGAARRVRAPAMAQLDHAVGFAGAAAAMGAIAQGRTGRLEVSHATVASLGARVGVEEAG